MKRTALTFALLWALSPAFAADTLKYVVLVDNGKPAGQQVVTTGDDGVVRTEFVFKDNGRGPELKEEYALDADGTFKSYTVTGVSTFGAKVDETFARSGGVARWKSTSEEGQVPAPAGAMYAPLGGTPQSYSATLAALAKRADGKLPLIPGGTLTQRRIDTAEVTGPKGARTLQLLAITGIGYTPSFVWATTDATPRLFAFIVPGYLQMVEDGYQAQASALETKQKVAEGRALQELQSRLAHRIAGTTLIRNARVFDSAAATLGAPQDVLLRDGTIVSAGAPGSAGAADRVVDAGGRVLMPGLFDMHGHVSRWSGGLHVAAGVTTVRDMGNDNATVQQIIAEERGGTLLGPRIVAAGFLEGESPMSARNGFVVADLAAAKKAVDWYAANGYVQLKIYNSFPKDILRDTVAYAHEKGLRVSGHVPVYLRAQDVVDAGFDEINHINQVLLNFLVKPDTDTRTLERFYLPAKGVADLDFDGKPVQDFIASLKANDVAVDATMATFAFLRHRAGDINQLYAPVAEHLPPDVQRGLRVAELDIPDDATEARYTRSYEKMVEFVGRLYKAGVPIVAGTDEIAGFTLQHELELLVKAGLTPAQALQVATHTAAKIARAEDRGIVAPGKRADLILVDGEPTANVSDIRNVAMVIKGDTAYYPAEIYEALGIKPFAEPLRLPAATPTSSR